MAEATTHPHHAEMLAGEGHTDKTCKVCRAGGRKSLGGRNPLGNLKMSEMLLQLCSVTEVFIPCLRLTHSH